MPSQILRSTISADRHHFPAPRCQTMGPANGSFDSGPESGTMFPGVARLKPWNQERISSFWC